MKIITIRQPYASALLAGIYDAERRKFRIEGPTLIHAAKDPAMQPKDCARWLLSRDPMAAHALDWATGKRDDMPDESPMSTIIMDSVADFEEAFPFGRIIGYVDGWDPVREGLGWANRPINPVHFDISVSMPQYKGALGHLPCPDSVVDLVRAWIPQT